MCIMYLSVFAADSKPTTIYLAKSERVIIANANSGLIRINDYAFLIFGSAATQPINIKTGKLMTCEETNFEKCGGT